MSGGINPVSPSDFRSSAVNAVPLFKWGVLSTARPRALVSKYPSPCGRLAKDANNGTTLRRLLFSFTSALPWPAIGHNCGDAGALVRSHRGIHSNGILPCSSHFEGELGCPILQTLERPAATRAERIRVFDYGGCGSGDRIWSDALF